MAPQLDSTRIGGYHEAAAVLSWYDPDTIRPAKGSHIQDSIEDLLIASDLVKMADGTRRWVLQSDTRVTVLRQLREQQRLNSALRANPTRAEEPRQQILEGYLKGKPLVLSKQSLTQLSATYEIYRWLREAGFSDLPNLAEINRLTERLTFLEPFEHLASDEHFCGRDDELERLRNYVEVLPPQSTIESLRRFVVKHVTRFEDKPPLLIYGPGGVGKSTLIARFILLHAGTHATDPFPFAYLNFERPDIVQREPLTLLAEAVRQIGIEYTHAREHCNEIRNRWLRLVAEDYQERVLAVGEIKSGSRAVRSRLAAIQDFADLTESLGAQHRPVVFVLDTFEEVQRSGDEHVSAIWRFLEALQASVPRLRVTIVGRAEVRGVRTDNLALTGLPKEVAISFLRAKGVEPESIARQISEQVGGNPLSLKLAVELFAREGVGKNSKLDIESTQFLFFRLTDEQIQRQLYKRILGRIQNESVMKLAHPGLVLRRLTPEIVMEVLATPCGLSLPSIKASQDLFNELKREVSLVSVDADGALRHRQDVRLLMLKLLDADEPDKVRSIHEHAVDFYSKQISGPIVRAEEIYHRLWVGYSSSDIDSRWISGVEQYLYSAVQEFSGWRKAYLASRLNVEVDEETRSLARAEEFDRLLEQQISSFIGQRKSLSVEEVEQILKPLHARSERTAKSFALEAVLLEQASLWTRSFVALENGIHHALKESDQRQAFTLVLRAAELVLKSGLVNERTRQLARLEEMGRTDLSDIDRLELLVRQLSLAREADAPDQVARFKQDLRNVFDRVPDQQLCTQSTLVRWIGALLSEGDNLRLLRVIRLVGVPHSGQEAMRELAAGVASLDLAVSTRRGEVVGTVLRQMGIQVGDSLIESWTTYLLTAPDTDVQHSVLNLIEQNVECLRNDMITKFSAVMYDTLGFKSTMSEERGRVGFVSLSPLSTRVSQKELVDLVKTLIENFPAIEEIRDFVHYRLDRRVDAITQANNVKEIWTDLVAKAVRQGWLLQMVAKAREARPIHAPLASVARKLGLSTLAIARNNHSFADVISRLQWLGTVESQVCSVEVDGKPCGTGFLVGIDLVLTAEFVISDIFSGKKQPQDLALRFDYKSTEKGQVVSPGVVFSLAPEWLVKRSEYGETRQQLGYALLRVANSPGAQPIGSMAAEPAAVLRRWIEFPSSFFTLRPGSGLLMVHHPLGAPLRIATNEEAIVSISDDVARIYYRLATEPGSSGSPCFTMDGQLVAFHVGRTAEKGSSFGVLLSAVQQDLKESGSSEIIGQQFR